MNIYVGNLDYSLNEDDLRGIFEEYGEVESVKIIIDRETNRSKGFGFVEMNDEDGQKAIDDLDGAELNDRPLRVNVAQKRDNNRGGGGFRRNNNRGGGGYQRRDNNRGGGGYRDRNRRDNRNDKW